ASLLSLVPLACGDDETLTPLEAAGAAPLDATSSSDAADGDTADAATGDAPPGDAAHLRILFIGNSYTYVNDLPATLARIAATAGVPPSILTDQIAQPGARLGDYWNADGGAALKKIDERGWTHVVLQAQSVEPADQNTALDFLTYARDFGE